MYTQSIGIIEPRMNILCLNMIRYKITYQPIFDLITEKIQNFNKNIGIL